MLSRMVCAGGSNERVLETKFGVLLMPRWHSEEALSFLGRLLADPWAEHLLVGSVKPTEALYDQDIFELVALVDDIKRFEAPKIQDPSAALWCWLYHTLGGAEKNLLQPPAKQTNQTRTLLTKCQKDRALKAPKLRKLRLLMKQAWKQHFKGRSSVGDRGVALHVWLYHLGLQRSKLRAPPASLKCDDFTKRLLDCIEKKRDYFQDRKHAKRYATERRQQCFALFAL